MSMFISAIKAFCTSARPSTAPNPSKIIVAFNRGLFAPFANAMKSRDDSWDKETYWSHLQNYMQGKEVSASYVRNLELFAVSIDPKLTDEEKSAFISEEQKNLNEEDRKSRLYGLARSLPPVMSANILRFSDQDCWRGIARLQLGYRSICCYEEPYCKWMQEVANHSWPDGEVEKFLNEMTEPLPPSERDQVLCYFLLHTETEIQEQFAKIAPESLSKRMAELKRETIEFGEKILETKTPQRIPFRDNQRILFLSWFKLPETYRHPDADLIALHLDVEDWKWLQRKNLPNKLSIDWMVSISQRLSQDELKESGHNHDPGIWLFYRRASEMALSQGTEEFLREGFAQIGHLLTAPLLKKYSSAFETGKAKQFILDSIVTRSPEKFVDCIQLILSSDLEYRQTISKEISDLVDGTSKKKEALTQIFRTGQTPLFTLNVYSALYEENQKMALDIILGNPPNPKYLVDWVDLWISKPKEFLPHLREAFAKDFYRHLMEKDPNLPAQLADFYTEVPSLSVLLPVGIDLADPATRQKLALKKLKEHFLTRSIAHDDRRTFVRSLREDLKGADESKNWPKVLFDELPEETWPLIFLHFDIDIHRSSYFAYSEEKSKGGVFRSVDVHNPVSVNWLPEMDQWVDLAARTLCQMVDNPLLLEGKSEIDHSVAAWSMQHLYQAGCKTNTIHLIMQRFIEIVPPGRFIAIIGEFGRAAFFYHSEKLRELVAEALDHAKVDRLDFIASTLEAHHGRKRSLFHHSVQLDENFWDAPFLKTSRERTNVALKLLLKMNVKFIGYFSRLRNKEAIVKSFIETDQNFAIKFFSDTIDVLCVAKDDEDFKLSAFQGLCEEYQDAGVDVLNSLIDHPNWKTKFQEWFANTDFILENYRFTNLGVKILKHFEPDQHLSIIKAKCIRLLSQDHFWQYDFNRFLRALEKNECKDSLLQLIRETPELVELAKKAAMKNFRDNFTCYSDSLTGWPTFVRELFPDWQQKLIDWSLEKIKEDEAEAMSQGEDPTYHQLVDLFMNLDRADLLKDWLETFKIQETELEATFQKIEIRVLKQKEKNAKEREEREKNKLSKL